MRSVVVAGVGGLLLGHIAWLILISLATASSSISTWVLVFSLLVIIGAVWFGVTVQSAIKARQAG